MPPPPLARSRILTLPLPAGVSTAIQYREPAVMLTDETVMAFQAFALGLDVEPLASSWPGLPLASA